MPADELIDDGELEPEDEHEPTGGGRFSKLPLIAVGVVVAIVVVIGAHGLMASNRITSQTATSGMDDTDDAQNRARLKALEVAPAASPAPLPPAPVIPQQVQQPLVLQPHTQRTPSPDEQWAHDQLMLARQAPPMVKPVHDHSTLELAQTQAQGDIAGAHTGNSVTLHPPAAPYSVMAGSIVPALLITGINSDIPGPIVAQVSQNVFDSATGKNLLIPQGSRLLGDYGSTVNGVPRIRIDFRRLIFPNTASMDLPQMPGGDQGGYTGMTGDVNNHYVSTFGTAAVMALIGAGQAVGTMAAFGNNMSNGPYGSYQQPNQWESASQTAGQGATTQFSNLGTEMARRGLNRPPTIIIPAGALFNVIITADLQMQAPYKE